MNETAQLLRDYSREIGYTINEFLAAGHAVASWKLWWALDSNDPLSAIYAARVEIRNALTACRLNLKNCTIVGRLVKMSEEKYDSGKESGENTR